MRIKLRPPFAAALCGSSGAVLASMLVNPCNPWPLIIWAAAWAIALRAKP